MDGMDTLDCTATLSLCHTYSANIAPCHTPPPLHVQNLPDTFLAAPYGSHTTVTLGNSSITVAVGSSE